MIGIFSAEPGSGILYTDEKKHFFIDGELIQEKAKNVKIDYLKNRIAKAVGFSGADEMLTFLRCSGVTENVFEHWIMTGTLAENLYRLRT